MENLRTELFDYAAEFHKQNKNKEKRKRLGWARCASLVTKLKVRVNTVYVRKEVVHTKPVSLNVNIFLLFATGYENNVYLGKYHNKKGK